MAPTLSTLAVGCMGPLGPQIYKMFQLKAILYSAGS